MLRRSVWWATIFVAVVLGSLLIRDAWDNYHGWRTTVNDPSAKDAYLTFLEGDLILLALLGVVTASVLWLLARWRRRRDVSSGA